MLCWTHNHKIIFFLLQNCNFATIINCNVNLWFIPQKYNFLRVSLWWMDTMTKETYKTKHLISVFSDGLLWPSERVFCPPQRGHNPQTKNHYSKVWIPFLKFLTLCLIWEAIIFLIMLSFRFFTFIFPH